MISRIYAKLKKDGLPILLKDIKTRFWPAKLKSFARYKHYFQGESGFEIGGPSPIFMKRGHIPVYSIAGMVDNCNFGSETIWEGKIHEGETFIYDKKKPAGQQFCLEASNLQGIESAKYDFVLSSHCIEHLANPLRGLEEWVRILRENGVLVLVIPHKDGTFDLRRPVTSLSHLIDDYESQMDEGDLTHLDEILALHDLDRDPGAGDPETFRKRAEMNVNNRSLHHHVFDTDLAVEVVHQAGLQILTVQHFHPFHIAIIAKKVPIGTELNNAGFRCIRGAPCWSSPFPSDQKYF